MKIILILSFFILLVIMACISCQASNPNTVNRLLRISENEAGSKKRIALL